MTDKETRPTSEESFDVGYDMGYKDGFKTGYDAGLLEAAYRFGEATGERKAREMLEKLSIADKK